jgi:hypothetical protein
VGWRATKRLVRRLWLKTTIDKQRQRRLGGLHVQLTGVVPLVFS